MTAGEQESLLGFLEHFRATLRRQCEGLTDEQLRQTHDPSTLTLAGLLKHLSFVENFWVRHLVGGDRGEPWSSVDWKRDWGWEFRTALDDTGEELLALHAAETAACDEVLERVLADDGLDTVGGRRHHGKPVTVRFAVLQVVQEYARHCGHADLIRESIDGSTGL